MARHSTDRRTFLKASLCASTAFAIPTIIPSSAFGANERIITGHIGVGGRGGGNLRSGGGQRDSFSADRMLVGRRRSGHRPKGWICPRVT